RLSFAGSRRANYNPQAAKAASQRAGADLIRQTVWTLRRRPLLDRSPGRQSTALRDINDLQRVAVELNHLLGVMSLSRPSTSLLPPLPTSPRTRGRVGRGKAWMPATTGPRRVRRRGVIARA